MDRALTARTGFGDPTVGIGIVGPDAADGRVSAAHVPALSAVDGIELRGSVVSPASGRAPSEAHRVPAYASVERLAQARDVDLIVVVDPASRHGEFVLPALEAGVPVLSEWPLAADLGEAQELERAAHGTRTFVGLPGRSSPTIRWLADLVSHGYVGRVLSASVVAPVERSASVQERMSWGHLTDLVAMVIGEPEDVLATPATSHNQAPLDGATQTAPTTAEEEISVSGALSGGATLSVRLARGAKFSLIIEGTRGALEVSAPEYPHLGQVTVRGTQGQEQRGELRLPYPYDKYPHLDRTPFHELAHTYQAIRDDLVRGTAVVPDFSHAVRRHRLLDAIARSAATGRRTKP